MGFRDEREALIAKLRALEHELEGMRVQVDREALAREIAELAKAVEAAEERLQADRSALSEIAERIDGLRTRVGLPAPQPPAPASRPTSGAAWVGCLAVVIALVGGIGLAATHRSTPSSQLAPSMLDPATSRPLPGGVHRFDPVAGLSVARDLAGPTPLTGIELRYVSSDGTIDLEHAAYQGSAEYQFGEQGPRESAAPDAPVGAPPSNPFRTAVWVRVGAAGFNVVRDNLAVLSSRSVPLPECTPADVWRAAIQHGAPPDAVAIVHYRAGITEAAQWHLTIDGTDVDVRIPDPGCGR